MIDVAELRDHGGHVLDPSRPQHPAQQVLGTLDPAAGEIADRRLAVCCLEATDEVGEQVNRHRASRPPSHAYERRCPEKIAAQSATQTWELNV
jgi:hypothetical protein